MGSGGIFDPVVGSSGCGVTTSSRRNRLPLFLLSVQLSGGLVLGPGAGKMPMSLVRVGALRLVTGLTTTSGQ